MEKQNKENKQCKDAADCSIGVVKITRVDEHRRRATSEAIKNEKKTILKKISNAKSDKVTFTACKLKTSTTIFIHIGFCPNDRMATPNSFVEMVPFLSLSNIMKASRNSSTSSGVN
ncbi:hypothetical protein T10_12367 [Trichinella papuae]|uniref:Uncharacterized protein n=1 Tax=Trichinella papuae TaxID=268474 RepID=A0A0V1M614_9BILA|nr:hypothetical protein T10_12367 [Trichinella papuae]